MAGRGSSNAKAMAAADNQLRPLALSSRGDAFTDAGREMLRAFYGDGALFAKALALYEDENRIGDTDRDIDMSTDVNLRCGAGLSSRLHDRIAPTWRYEFTHGYAPLGAVHIWDMQYVFGVMSAPADQPRDLGLSKTIQMYWTNFAKGGDPNHGSLPAWPRASTSQFLDFASTGAVVREDPRTAECNLFDRRIDEVVAAQLAKE